MHCCHAKNPFHERRPAGRRQPSDRLPCRPGALCIALLLCATAGCTAPWWHRRRAREVGYAATARECLSYRDHSLGPPNTDWAGYHRTIWDPLDPIGPLPSRTIIGQPTPAGPHYEQLPDKAPPEAAAEPPDGASLPRQPDLGTLQLPDATARQRPAAERRARSGDAVSRWLGAERRSALSPIPTGANLHGRRVLHGGQPERPMIAFRHGTLSSYSSRAPDVAAGREAKQTGGVHTRPARLRVQNPEPLQRPDTGMRQAVRFLPLPAAAPTSRSYETPARCRYEAPADCRHDAPADCASEQAPQRPQPPRAEGSRAIPADRGHQPVTARQRRTPAARLLQRLQSTAGN